MLQGFFVCCETSSIALAETTADEQHRVQEWIWR